MQQSDSCATNSQENNSLSGIKQLELTYFMNYIYNFDVIFNTFAFNNHGVGGCCLKILLILRWLTDLSEATAINTRDN